MDVMINLANVLYLFSYFVRDGLKMRVLTVLAASCLLPYFYFRAEPLMIAIYWNTFFMALNGCWILRLVLDRVLGAGTTGGDLLHDVQPPGAAWGLLRDGRLPEGRE